MNRLVIGAMLVLLAAVLMACQPGPAPAGAIDEQQAVDRAWEALRPNTRSQDRANWDVVEVRRVSGQEVAAQFEGQAAAGCWHGPTPAPNAAIDPAGAYWYVHLQPRPATAVPQPRTVSPTEPPAIPEPFLRDAHLLLDAGAGQVVARKLYCVIY